MKRSSCLVVRCYVILVSSSLTYSLVVTEHVSRRPFVDFGYSDLMKPLEVWRAELCVQDDDGSVEVGSRVSVVPAEEIRLRPARETLR